MFYSTKTFGTDRGFSCCFRQWRATHSHCSHLHGYALGFRFIFQSETLDGNNWVFDFGNYQAIKAWLDYMFDHTLLVSCDDPELTVLKDLNDKGLCNLREVSGTGCEMFAQLVYQKSISILDNFKNGTPVMVDGVDYRSKYLIDANVTLKSVEVFEHSGNSAIYEEN